MNRNNKIVLITLIGNPDDIELYIPYFQQKLKQ